MVKNVFMKCSICGIFVDFSHFSQDNGNMYCSGEKASGFTYDENLKPTTFYHSDIIIIPNKDLI